jgi:hypothetical protein
MFPCGCLANQAPTRAQGTVRNIDPKQSRCIPARGFLTYLRSEVGAIATDASADNPGSEVVPGWFSCLESSGGNVVDGGVVSGCPNE